MDRHWTQILKDENDALKRILRDFLSDASLVVESRISKEAVSPSGGEYGLGYMACAKEIDLRIREAKDAVWDELFKKGINLPDEATTPASYVRTDESSAT